MVQTLKDWKRWIEVLRNRCCRSLDVTILSNALKKHSGVGSGHRNKTAMFLTDDTMSCLIYSVDIRF